MLGRFHEISLETHDIRASVEFYEKLGFTQAQTGDTWPHPYGVLTDGRIFLGLHQQSLQSPCLSFVRPGVADHALRLQALDIELELLRTGEENFNELAFRDPGGQRVRVLEARTYSPVLRRPEEMSACGYFREFSVPAADFDALARFWERLGFVAGEAIESPYPHLTLTSDHLNLAVHAPRCFDHPMLVFSDDDMRSRLARLQSLGITPSNALPRSLDRSCNALLEAPEGTVLLLLSEQD